MDAALDLLAERGEDRITLVELRPMLLRPTLQRSSYHFELAEIACEAALEQALERYLDEEQEA